MNNNYGFLQGDGAVRAHLRSDQTPILNSSASPLSPSVQAILSIVLDSNVPMFVCLGVEMRLIYNDAYSGVLGGKHPSALGQPLWSVWPEVRLPFEHLISRTLSGVPVLLEDVRCNINRNGSPKHAWFTFSFAPIRELDGRIVGLFATVNETTRYVLAAKTNELREVRARTIFEQAPGFVAILRGPDHVFEVVNAAYRKLVGRSALIGLPARAALPELVDQGFFELLDNVYSSGAPLLADGVSITLYRSADGALEERFVRFVYQPILEDDGSVSGIFVEGSDVTSEHHGRHQLAAQMEMLRLAEERLQFQLVFSDQIRHIIAAEEITLTASRLLGSYLKASRVLYANVREDGSMFDAQSIWVAGGHTAPVESARNLSDYGPEIHASLANGEVVVVTNIADDRRTALHKVAYEQLPVAAFICIPLVKSGRLVALLSVHQTLPTDWPTQSIELTRDTAERTWDALERAQAQGALRIQRDESQRILDSITEGFMVLGPDWRVHQVNAEGLKIGQRSREEVIGENLWELWPQIVGSELETRYRRAMAEGSPDLFEAHVDFLDGTSKWLEFRLYFVGQRAMAVLFRDISERRANEALLQESESKARAAAKDAEQERRLLGALLNAAPVGIAMTDADGRLIRVNEANFELWGRELPHSKSVDEYTEWKGWWADGSERHGKLLEAEDWALARAVHGETVAYDVVEIETFDVPPQRRTISLSAASVRDSSGAIVGAVVAQTNITALVEAERALRQADTRKDEFLAMLGHELRNPLAPIGSAAELLNMPVVDAAKVKRASEIIRRQVGHLTSLVDDLLDVSRVARGLVTLATERVDIKEVLTNAIEQAKPLIESRGHFLSVSSGLPTIMVKGDKKRLVQVITNLLNNAAKYTPANGNILLTVGVLKGAVRIEVRDNGIGMTDKTVEHVFELFAQAERTPDRAQGGLGIGLALVKRLVELHGGTVSAESGGLAEGSKFTVHLPLDEDAQVAIAPLSVQHAKAPVLPMSIMVVDDNADTAEMLAACLRLDGHLVTIETSAASALRTALADSPDVCMLDIGLPDFDGNELARRLNSHPSTVNATLIAVTGYGQERDIAASTAAGFRYHLVKPISTHHLQQVLSEIAERRAPVPPSMS